MDLLDAAKNISSLHPGVYYSDEDGSETRCFYCNELEVLSEDAPAKTMEMHRWLDANPGPQYIMQPIKRRDAPDMQEWDRENTRRQLTYNRQMGQWRHKYNLKYAEVWGDPKTHPGTVIHHKPDCAWVILKEALNGL